MEDLRRAIYYSSRSWSDGLPLLEQCLLSLTAGYGYYIPASTNHPVCPVIFSEEDTKRHEKGFRDVIYPEEWLDVHIRALMKTKGIVLHEEFEEAREKDTWHGYRGRHGEHSHPEKLFRVWNLKLVDTWMLVEHLKWIYGPRIWLRELFFFASIWYFMYIYIRFCGKRYYSRSKVNEKSIISESRTWALNIWFGSRSGTAIGFNSAAKCSHVV